MTKKTTNLNKIVATVGICLLTAWSAQAAVIAINNSSFEADPLADGSFSTAGVTAVGTVL